MRPGIDGFTLCFIWPNTVHIVGTSQLKTMWLNASIQVLLSFHCVYVCRWEHMSFCSCKWKGERKTSQKPALPTQTTRKHVRAGRHVTRRHSGWAVAFMFFTVSFSQTVSLSSLWGVITVVGSSRVGKRFSFPLSLPPSKLCTGYYRDLFTKCSFCLFLSSPSALNRSIFPFNFLPLLYPVWNSVCLLMYWLMPSSACPLISSLVSCLLSLSLTNTHTCTQECQLYENMIANDIEQLSVYDINDECLF